VRPEVREQRELVLLLVRPGAQGEDGVDRDGQYLDVVPAEGGQLVADGAQLSGADPAERQRV